MNEHELEAFHALHTKYKALNDELASIHDALNVPLTSSRPLACYVNDLKQQLGEAQDTIKQLREANLYLTQERESQP